MKYIKTYKNFNESMEEEIEEIDINYGIENNNLDNIAVYANSAISDFLQITPFWNTIKVICVKSLKRKSIIGLFRVGTSTSIPIILIDQNCLLKNSKKYKVSIETTTKTTVWHEIGHAVVELDKELNYNQLNFEDEEEFVENLAYEMFKYGNVTQDIENFYNFYIKNNK